jgi:hypothetical protein
MYLTPIVLLYYVTENVISGLFLIRDTLELRLGQQRRPVLYVQV